MKKEFLIAVLLFFVAECSILVLSDEKIFAANATGSLTGTVRYFGPIPPRESGPVKVDSEVCGSNYSEDVLINAENKGIKSAVISLKKLTDDKKSSRDEKRIYLISKKCHFEPNITAIQIDNSLNIENSDPILHVLKFSRQDQVLFTLPLPAHGSLVKRIDQTGLIQIKCVIHPFMKSQIAVLDTPLYSFSDPNGAFNFEKLDPGKYRLAVWYNGFGSMEKEIEIQAEKNTNLNFELKRN